ncbi:flagellar biosynthetic protein FliO [Chromatiaceae bacterium AAb-1]|jgi:flagellar protein FliO/FliZ|nr:flagellar biosynthetic protein FliO [Chromatiaceae bacterium AAb-1]
MQQWLKYFLFVVLLFAGSIVAVAQTADENTPQDSEQAVVTPDKNTVAAPEIKSRPAGELSLSNMVISLAIVIVVVLMLAWAFKKLTARLPGNRHVKIICAVPLGQRERLLVVEMQGKQRVLGVTAQSINFLFELENPLPEEKLASDFHTHLQSLLKK